MDCLVEGEAEAGGGATVSPVPALTGPRAFSKLDPADKQKLPVCQRCKGCNTRLSRINGMSTYFNITYKHEEGASSTWTFKASTKCVLQQLGGAGGAGPARFARTLAPPPLILPHVYCHAAAPPAAL